MQSFVSKILKQKIEYLFKAQNSRFLNSDSGSGSGGVVVVVVVWWWWCWVFQ
jgi:hypothetical protein